MKSRRTRVLLTYEGKDITKEIDAYLLDFSYTDQDKEGEDVQLTLENRDRIWLFDWFPKRGDEIFPTIKMENATGEGEDYEIPCGRFLVDEITASGSPNVTKLKAVSHLMSESSTESRSQSWEHIEFRALIGEIAKRNKMEAVFEIESAPFYDHVEQRQLSDMAFVKKLSEDRGFEVKVENKRLIITQEQFYEKREPVFTIRFPEKGKEIVEGDLLEVLSWEFVQSSLSAYEAAEVAYKDPKSGKTMKAKVQNDTEEKTLKKTLKVHQKVASEEEAKKLARQKLDGENKKIQRARFSVFALRPIAAKQVIAVKGWGGFDGKYLIMSVAHHVSNSGYTVDLECTRVNKGDKRGDLDEKNGAAQGGVSGATGTRVIDIGLTAKGKVYNWGGTDPFRGGADCSGFVTWAYKKAGHPLPRRLTSASLRNNPKGVGFYEVPFSERRPGDVLWAKGHVGMVYDKTHVLECGGTTKAVYGKSCVGVTKMRKSFTKCYRRIGE